MPNQHTTTTTPNYIIHYWVASIISAAVCGYLVFSMTKSLRLSSLQHIVTGLVVGSASLLLVLSSRSSVITERIRRLSDGLMQNILTYGPSYESNERRHFTKEQLDILKDRLNLSLMAVSFQLLTILCLVAAVIAAFRVLPIDNFEQQSIDVYAASCFGIAGFFFAFGVVSTLLDLWLSRRALLLELKFATSIPEKYEPRLDSRNTDTVIHFNNLFFSIWYEGSLCKTLETTASSKAKAKSERLVIQYYGIHREEFYFFALGLLPRAVYKRWLEHVRKVLEHKPVEGSPNIKSRWRILLQDEANSEFKTHMMAVLDEMVSIDELLGRLDH